MTKRKDPPKSPEQVMAERLAKRRQEFEAVGLQAEAANLATAAMLEVRPDSRKNALSARRVDVFDALKDGMASGAYDAARRLERDMRMRRGEHGSERSTERVDEGVSLYGRHDRIIAAAERVEAVLSKIGERDAWLLSELIYPRIERTWRQIVAHITGESNPIAQAAAVRSACANLAQAYERRLAA